MTLVAYFSATGTTGIVAGKIASLIEADIYEIVPEVLYTNADLDWKDKSSRSSVEMKDPSSRPAIGSGKVEDMELYDTIILMAPIWWYRYPTIMNTFLESYDMSGKKIILLATSGGSGLGKSADSLRDSAPGADIVDGEVIRNVKTDADLKAVVEKYLNNR